MTILAVKGEIDENSLKQLQTCIAAEEGAIGGVCADHHVGYSQPIGAYVAYRDHVSPSGVGYDIGCGNLAVLTDLRFSDLKPYLKGLMQAIFNQIDFGIGSRNRSTEDPVLDKIARSELGFQRHLLPTARQQLGTVGSGNHYVDIFRDDKDRVWIGVHFGSRGFGHKTATHFLDRAREQLNTHSIRKDDMYAPPVLLPISSELGQEYIYAMGLAGEYAYAGREHVVRSVASILGAAIVESVHNHHNFAWKEEHGGVSYWVHRKGCTPAWPDQQGFVGGSMGDVSVILKGKSTVDGLPNKEQIDLLMSTVHGAGRVMSRTKAAGKLRKRWICPVRDCSTMFENENRNGSPALQCKDHPHIPPRKMKVRVGAAIDFASVRKELHARGIILKGGGADEAPGAYKSLPTVLAAHAGSVDIQTVLYPVGVCMAGTDTHDPYPN